MNNLVNTPLKPLMSFMLLLLAVSMLAGCGAPEVGSDEWCTKLKDKSKGDWTMNEASDFAKHCVFK